MEIFNLLGRISIYASQANEAIDDTTNNAQDAANEQEEAFSRIGSAAGTLAKGVLAVGTVLGGAFIASIEATREYRTSMGQLETGILAGQPAPEIDSRLADIYKHSKRGNTR